MNTAYTKLALGFVCILTLMFSSSAENLYFKLDLLNTQLNTNIAFQQKGAYTSVVPSVVSDSKNLERQSIRNIDGFTIGYPISEYCDVEIDFNNYRHKFNRPGTRFETVQNTIKSTTRSRITSNLFAFAYNDERPYCNQNPNTFLNREEICTIQAESSVRHNLFAFAYNEDGAYCSSIPDTFLNKEEICGTQEVTSTLSSLSTGISSTKVFSKIDILLPRARVKFINNPGFILYALAGIGLAQGYAKIINFTVNANRIDINTQQKHTRALASEFGIGAVVRIKKMNIDIEAKYFNYGKHMFVANNPTRAKGYSVISALAFYW